MENSSYGLSEKSLKKCALGLAQSLLKNWWRKSNLGSDMRSASEKESLLPIVKVIYKRQEPAEIYVRPPTPSPHQAPLPAHQRKRHRPGFSPGNF
jgi:hypothetical protein